MPLGLPYTLGMQASPDVLQKYRLFFIENKMSHDLAILCIEMYVHIFLFQTFEIYPPSVVDYDKT